ncbi:hypothetical protein AAKU58_003962 [Oxalobacteraceae bacterium GrIS 1.18]
MSEKVKMSVFVESDVARAVKMQSASQGYSGISQVIRSVFLCAHCREPITDAFIVGSPKLTEQGKDGNPDKFSVFFHKNREECRIASGQRIAYMPVCTNKKCNHVTHQSFDEKQLAELLARDGVKFYCISCDHSWAANAADKTHLCNLLEEHRKFSV